MSRPHWQGELVLHKAPFQSCHARNMRNENRICGRNRREKAPQFGNSRKYLHINKENDASAIPRPRAKDYYFVVL
jgi:hypothetical protein